MMKICPSIASGDVLNLQAMCDILKEQYGHIHIDIEDGNYINNITFGMKTVRAICAYAACETSVHLMVMDPRSYLEDMKAVKPDIIFIHLDCCRYPALVINEYKKAGLAVGIALNPAEAMDRYSYLKEQIQDVLVMMCEPDGYGQQYQGGIEEKAEILVGEKYRVWLDGGMSWEKAKEMGLKGVYAAVMGRSVFESAI